MTTHRFSFKVEYAPMDNLRAEQRRTLVTRQTHRDFLAAHKCALDYAMANSGPTERIVSVAVELTK
jgi:hypothetical protein